MRARRAMVFYGMCLSRGMHFRSMPAVGMLPLPLFPPGMGREED
jgi:hypothetical protein